MESRRGKDDHVPPASSARTAAARFPHLRRGARGPPGDSGLPGPAQGPRAQAEKQSSDQRPPSFVQAAVTPEVTAHSVEPARDGRPGKAA